MSAPIYGMRAHLLRHAQSGLDQALDGSTKNLYVQGAAILIGLSAPSSLMSLIDLEGLRQQVENTS